MSLFVSMLGTWTHFSSISISKLKPYPITIGILWLPISSMMLLFVFGFGRIQKIGNSSCCFEPLESVYRCFYKNITRELLFIDSGSFAYFVWCAICFKGVLGLLGFSFLNLSCSNFVLWWWTPCPPYYFCYSNTQFLIKKKLLYFHLLIY